MSKQSIDIIKYLQEHDGAATAKEIAEALEMEKRRVDSFFSASVIRAGMGERDTSESPSVLRLNESGMAFEPEAEEEVGQE